MMLKATALLLALGLSHVIWAREVSAVRDGNKPVLGVGYDTKSDSFLSVQCVDAPPHKTGVMGSVFNFESIKDRTSLKNRLGITGQGRIDYGLVNGEASVSLLNESFQTNLSESVVFSFENKPQSETLIANVKNLPTIPTELLKQPEKFATICGDEYVNQIEYKDFILVSLRVDYADTSSKQELSGKLNVSVLGIGAISGALQNLKASGNTNTRVTLRALQQGGEPHRLLSAFGGLSKDKMNPIVTCGYENYDDCSKAISNVIEYASNDFANQFSAPGRHSPVKYLTQSYLSGGVIIVKPADPIPDDVLQFRTRLLDLYERNTDIERRIAAMLNMKFLNSTEKESLIQNQKIVWEKLNLIKQVAAACFDNIRECKYDARFQPIPEQSIEIVNRVKQGEANNRALENNPVLQPWMLRNASATAYCRRQNKDFKAGFFDGNFDSNASIGAVANVKCLGGQDVESFTVPVSKIFPSGGPREHMEEWATAHTRASQYCTDKQYHAGFPVRLERGDEDVVIACFRGAQQNVKIRDEFKIPFTQELTCLGSDAATRLKLNCKVRYPNIPPREEFGILFSMLDYSRVTVLAQQYCDKKGFNMGIPSGFGAWDKSADDGIISFFCLNVVDYNSVGLAEF